MSEKFNTELDELDQQGVCPCGCGNDPNGCVYTGSSMGLSWKDVKNRFGLNEAGKARYKKQLIERFRQNQNLALAALLRWGLVLDEWKSQPQVPDDEFMTEIQNLSQAGLLDFIDGQPIDDLRYVITGMEA